VTTHLVLVHGSRLSSTQWAPQLPLLHGRVTVGLVDLPGHGRRAAEEFTLERCAEVIEEAVAAAPSGAPVVLVGHSLGGYAAMAYGAGRASALSGLVLAGCSATPLGAGAAIYRWVARATDRLGPDRMTRINDRVLRRLYPADRIDAVIEGGYYFTPTAAAWDAVMAECRPSMLWGVECPVLVLNGQYDQFRIGVGEVLRACRHAQVKVIRGAGHLANLDRPAAFADALLRFADSVQA
jgi:pimeloyl-ACP methyl ester carboxylesterase